ncbi:phosphotransferase [Mesorhizobium sp. NZP2298]|uniref:phosphotransferase n=1 Tax=Mesorhizobium sp. NZP2298 TaxID=2483403 RepID=UPI0015522A50|nr:phosphotransferase [Mesorhizobium sp. NZP2298]QKC95909.1 hypothetical protein EB231_15195 [Mesorhizobium sp. NZP2298]
MNLPALLAEPELIQLLIGKGLISRKDFVSKDVRLSLAERRNRNVKITIGGSSGLFTKQAKSNIAVATIFRESTVLDLLSSTQDDLSHYLPRKLAYDAKLGLLISALIPNGRSLHDILMQQRTLPHGHAQAAGRALACLHNRAVPGNLANILQSDPPIQWNRPHYSVLRNISPANVRLLLAVQNDAELSEGLDDLQSNWSRTSVIHGDAKLDNIVISPDGLALVDWELSTTGEPGWDVGTVFAGLLFSWIASMPMAQGTNHDLMAREASLPLSGIQNAAAQFWGTYASAAGVDSKSEFLHNAIRFCGARLVQTAYEYMQYSSRLTANAIYLLQVAANLIKSPDRGVGLLLAHS